MSSLISRIKRDPVGFSVTPTGRLLTTLFRSVPSAYDTDQYSLVQTNKPIKIVFSGMGDSQVASYAKDRFTEAYTGQPVYIFGHGQLQQALDFANKIPRQQPVQVFGYSWGSPTAMKFIDKYNGNISKAHYIDPMRHAVVDDAVISNKKNVPTTYMTAGEYGGDRKLKDALLSVLRMQPAQGMTLLPKVKNHMALQQALKYIKQSQQHMQKSAGCVNRAAPVVESARLDTANKQVNSMNRVYGLLRKVASEEDVRYLFNEKLNNQRRHDMESRSFLGSLDRTAKYRDGMIPSLYDEVFDPTPKPGTYQYLNSTQYGADTWQDADIKPTKIIADQIKAGTRIAPAWYRAWKYRNVSPTSSRYRSYYKGAVPTALLLQHKQTGDPLEKLYTEMYRGKYRVKQR